VQETKVIQANNPQELKAAVDALIAGGKVIEKIEGIFKSWFIVIYK